MKISACNNISDLRTVARRRLPEPVFHYLDGGSDDEVALRRNTTAFDDYELIPRQLMDVSSIDTGTTLFGQSVASPVMLSPTGGSRLFHADGERIAARVAADAGLIYSLSTLATTTIEDVATASAGPKLFQLYMFDDRGFTEELIARAQAQGYVALALTVDTPVAGNRERDLIYGFSARPRSRFRQVASFMRHPLWLKRALIDRDLKMANLVTSPSMQARHQSDLRTFIVRHLERSLTWKDVEWLRARWDGTLVIKGVQSVGDCQKARAAGADAVMISNHGGRQLDAAPAPIDCISRIADALAGDLEIVCDGGIRRGSHVVKALAAGANAVGIGRAYLFGLAAGGEAGVRHALTLLHNELVNCMGLAGVRSVAEIQRNLLQRRQ